MCCNEGAVSTFSHIRCQQITMFQCRFPCGQNENSILKCDVTQSSLTDFIFWTQTLPVVQSRWPLGLVCKLQKYHYFQQFFYNTDILHQCEDTQETYSIAWSTPRVFSLSSQQEPARFLPTSGTTFFHSLLALTQVIKNTIHFSILFMFWLIR